MVFELSVSRNIVVIFFRQYNLKTLFYETVADPRKYITVTVSRKNNQFKRIEDLKGMKACFPSYDGVAWHSVIYALQKKGIIGNKYLLRSLSKF